MRSATPYAVVALAAATVFAWLCDAVGDRDGVTMVDAPVASWFATHRTVGEGHVGLIVARATGPLVLLLVTALLAGAMWRRGERGHATVLGVSVVGAYGLGGLAKFVEHRVRPAAPINLAPEAEPSFPSGHVLVVSTIVGVLLVLAWQRLSRAARLGAASVAVASVLAVALDRLVVGAHWLTDVVGAVALSLVIVACAAAVSGRTRTVGGNEGRQAAVRRRSTPRPDARPVESTPGRQGPAV